MTTLHTIGDYRIASEKEDDCLPNWAWEAVTLGICLFVAFSLCQIYQSITNYNIWYPGIFLLAGSVFLILYPRLNTGCGVKILYIVPDRTKECHHEQTYKFTNNPETDAMMIREIIDKFVDMAEGEMARKNAQDEATKKKMGECCTQYKAVMEKVKNE